MSKPDDKELIHEMRNLRESIDELSGLLRSIFHQASDNQHAQERTAPKKKSPSGAVEKESTSSEKRSPNPGRHF